MEDNKISTRDTCQKSLMLKSDVKLSEQRLGADLLSETKTNFKNSTGNKYPPKGMLFNKITINIELF